MTIRVTHVLPRIGAGGVERRRSAFAAHLDAKKFELHVVCLEATGPLASELSSRVAGLHVLGYPRLTPRAVFEAIRVVQCLKPDVVHGAVFEGCLLAVLAGRLAGSKAVVIEETSHATNRSWRGHALFRGLSAAANATIAVSPAVGEYLATVTRVKAEKLIVIPNAIASPVGSGRTEVEIRRSLGLRESDCVIGTAGRMDDLSHKRFDDLIRAMPLILDKVPAAKLLIVGDGPGRTTLQNLARQLSLDKMVVFPGYLFEMRDAYAAMDVFALVSGREAFGLVVAEAMLCGLPIVATDVGGIPDVVGRDGAGVLVPVGSVDRIANEISVLLADPARRLAMGELARVRAERHFGMPRYTAEVTSLYDRLLAGR